ncbi:sialidase [Actinomycetales bacterium SN12]|nr:sialidase [Actinomycetales bacterium SN12]
MARSQGEPASWCVCSRGTARRPGSPRGAARRTLNDPLHRTNRKACPCNAVPNPLSATPGGARCSSPPSSERWRSRSASRRKPPSRHLPRATSTIPRWLREPTRSRTSPPTARRTTSSTASPHSHTSVTASSSPRGTHARAARPTPPTPTRSSSAAPPTTARRGAICRSSRPVTQPRRSTATPIPATSSTTRRAECLAFFVYSKDVSFQGSRYGNDDADRNIISAAVIHSDDQGVTWSEPELITDVVKPANGTVVNGAYQPVAGDVRGVFATSGEGIQLRYGEHAGRLIQQYAAHVRQADGSEAIQAYSVYSDDHGATWQRGAFVGTGMDENKVVELSDGRVMLNSRDSSNGRQRKVAISTDGGATYGTVTRDAELPDPTNNASITRLHPDAPKGSADARKLIFTNSNNGANGDRVNGAVRLSCDDGETWPGLRTLKTGFFAYSSATAIDDGRVGVLWEGDYTDQIRFSSFDEAWLNAVCAPVSVPETALQAGVAKTVPVTITNQEDTALSGTVSFHTPTGWTASDAAVTDLASGASVTVDVSVTAPAGAEGAQRLQAAFTTADGRLSQTTAALQLPLNAKLGATLSVTNTTAARDVVSNPYKVGEQLAFTVRVVGTSNVVSTLTPAANTFSSGFSPTACRWQNLAVGGAYNCTTPRRTLTQEDIDRGWFAPEFSFTITGGGLATVTASHTGAAVPLRDGLLDADISGKRTDTGRDLAADPYAAGERVPYSFRVDNATPGTVTVAPVAGPFAPFLPPNAGNCRYQNLPKDGGYTCATPRHTVTQDDVDRGYFTADTTWRVEAAGQTAKDIEVPGGEVDVIKRAPALAASISGEWTDANGTGVADAGDTVTWTRTVRNTGNVLLTDVTADGAELGSLAKGETRQLESQVVTLTVDDITAAKIAAERFAATASNGSLDVTARAEASELTLPTAPLWAAGTVYLKGDQVTHQGRLWEAGWWTRGEKPGSSVSGAWQEVAVNGDGEVVWTATQVFLAGDLVVHDGQRYEARWWTRGDEPVMTSSGKHPGAWKPVD